MVGCMIVGGLAALAVAKLVQARRCAHHGPGGWGWRHARCHGPWPGHSDGGWGGYGSEPEPGVRGWHDWRGERFVLGRVLARLRVTPGQERVITEAWAELRGELEQLRGEARRTRADIAAALRKPAFDEVLLGELYARHDRALEAARKGLVGFLAKTHDALEEEQRQMLADLIERGFWAGGDRW